MDQLQRDVLELLNFSLAHPPFAARFFFPMFGAEQIEALYAIPEETRQRIWANRTRPEFRTLFEGALDGSPDDPDAVMP
ncbi:MAG TPA: hypothetical protein VFI96_08155 [Longimicrobiaceae bacterium]|nr:hypothetical protein [Longimicrobiaceae bacterium]